MPTSRPRDIADRRSWSKRGCFPMPDSLELFSERGEAGRPEPSLLPRDLPIHPINKQFRYGAISMFMRHPLAATSRVVITATLLMTSLTAFAQFTTSNPSDPKAVETRVDDLVSKMTLDEKIDLIGGDTPFRKHAIERLH